MTDHAPTKLEKYCTCWIERRWYIPKNLHRQGSRDVASSADRHLDITFGLQVVVSSFLASVLLREAFSHPYIPFFHLLVNGFSGTCHIKASVL